LLKGLATPAEAPKNGAQACRETDRLLDRARLRGLLEREALLSAEGGTVSGATAARLLGISPQAVYKRRKAGKLIALTLGRRGLAYPVWQFDRGGTLSGLEAVLAELHEHDAWMQAAFMLGANVRLEGRTPLEELRRGDLNSVLRAARVFGEHGAA
jgi:hypothetical protein